MKSYIAILIFALSSLLISLQLKAQETTDSVITLGTVEVTAAKSGGESLKLQPVAATVVGAGEIDRLNILTMKDVSELSPNFYIPDYGSRMTSSIYMRGIGARIDQPVIGLNVDNVPFLNKDNYDFDLVDIERIEVLRGPQSTLYGRNTMGGQINIYTLSPMRYQGLRLMAEGGAGFTGRAALSYYFRPKRSWGMGISGYYNHCNGFYTNEYDGSKVGREDAGNLRWKTVTTPSPYIIAENTASFSINRQNGYPYEYLETGKINYNDPCHYYRWSLSDGLTIKYNGNGFNVTSITSFQYLDDDMTLDQDFLPLSYFTLTQKRKESALTQDFIFTGKSGNYSWLGGLFGFYKYQSMQAPVTFKDYGIEQLIEKHPNEMNPEYPIDWAEDSFVLNSDFSDAVYGLAAYHRSSLVLGSWKLEGALRLDFEHNSLKYHSHCNTAYNIWDMTDPANPTIFRLDEVIINDRDKLHCSFTQLLPKLSVSYTLPLKNPSIAYLSIAKGYKAGGYNTQMFSDVLQQRIMGLMGVSMNYDVDEIISYMPEHSWNYEIGTTLSLLSGRLNLEGAAFLIDCRNQQLTMFPEGTTTGRIMANAGKTRSLGVEVSAAWDATKNLLLNASYGYCDARFIKFNNGKEVYDGKRVPYAPQNTFFAGATYKQQLPNRQMLTFNINMRAIGNIWWDEANTVKQPLYGLLGASVTWHSRDNKLSLKLWGENLTDTHYTTFRFVSIGNTFLQRGKPLCAGITIRYNIDNI